MKAVLSFLFLLMTAYPSVGDPVGKKPVPDAEAIQGTWEVTSAFLEGKPAPNYRDVHFLFTRDEMYFGKKDAAPKDKYGANFKLNPSKKPKEIDVIHELTKGQPIVMPGIYELNEDNLKLAWEAAGVKRPSDFDTRSKTLSFITLKRVKKEAKSNK